GYHSRPSPNVGSCRDGPGPPGRVGTMRRRACLLGLLLAAALSGGCVERKFLVETDPPNVLVLVNNQARGPSPADDSFVYYGKYRFTLMAPGFETLHVEENVEAPWYEWWPLDFFFETLWPF